MSAAARNFHVPLPASLHRRLKEEAQRLERPATEIARQAIASWLDAARRAAIHDGIAQYAAAAAGGRDDLDPALEAASVEHLLGKRRSRKK